MTALIILIIMIAGAWTLGKWSDYDLKKRLKDHHPKPGKQLKKDLDRLLDLDEFELKSFHKN